MQVKAVRTRVFWLSENWRSDRLPGVWGTVLLKGMPDVDCVQAFGADHGCLNEHGP